MEWQAYPSGDDGKEHTIAGTVRVLAGVKGSAELEARDIYVYLPPTYHEGERRYPVVYMHDGQNLFDAATSFAGEWRVDETMEEAAKRGLEAIVVGISNTGPDRCDEYSPFEDATRGGGCGEEYLRFVIDVVKKTVDRDFRTLPEREHTGMFGSSMGGLITLYAYFRHPESFGFVGAMSPALWFAGRAIFPYVTDASAPAGRIYLDVGTAEGVEELADVRRMRKLLEAKGYAAPESLSYREEEGGSHSEEAWGFRLEEALSFLIPRSTSG